MSLRRRKRDGFLSEYELDQAYLQKPDAETGRPGMFAGFAPDGAPVLIKEWLRASKAEDADLEQIWRHELRQLHRLAGYPGASESIAPLYDAGEDGKAFYLVLAPGQRSPLQNILDGAGGEHWLKQPRNVSSRARMWANLQRLALGLEALHSQGLLHRNLDAWAVLTTGGAEPDFQLTGFEWSMRIASFESAVRGGKRGPAPNGSDSFAEDWKLFGLLAGDLVGAKRPRLLDTAVPPYDIAEHLNVDEARLLRGLAQLLPLSPLNGETITKKIDGILRNLAAEVANKRAKLHLVVRLGSGTALADKIREVSDQDIDTDDVESQHKFIIDDLSYEPLLMGIRQKDNSDIKLLLRGKNLLYRVQEYRLPRSSNTTWDFGFCERTENAPAPINVVGQQLLEGESLEIMTLRAANERYPRMRGKLLSWDEPRLKFEQAAQAPSREQTVHMALTLLQLLEAVYAAADVFTVNIHGAPAGVDVDSNEDGSLLYVTLSQDPEREALAKILGLKPQSARFLNIIENDGPVSESWILSDGRSGMERDPGDTEWQFQKILSRPGEQDQYIFFGQNPAPYLRAPVLYVTSVGRDVQFKRRLKALRALKEHHELLRMIADPRQRILESHDKLVEDDAFQKLDLPKQTALRQLTATLPLFLIQGPPGVGKTRLVRDLVRRRFTDEPSSRLLLTAQSNAAIDHLMDELGEVLSVDGKDAPLVVRSTKKDTNESRSKFDIREQSRQLVQRLAGSELSKELPARLRKTLNASAEASKQSVQRAKLNGDVSGRDAEQALRMVEGLVARAANVLFATTNSGELERLIDERGQFDWAIVEEAAKATGSELVSPLLLSHRRLMIGDHKQLPPFASDQLKKLLEQPSNVKEAMSLGEEFIGRSLRDPSTEDLLDEIETDDTRLPELCAEGLRLLNFFQSAIEAEFARQALKKSGRPTAKKLTAQHRMQPAIAELVSACFYGDLGTDPDCAKRFLVEERPYRSSDEEKVPLSPIVVVDMPYLQAERQRDEGERFPVWHNPSEVVAAVEVLRRLRALDDRKQPTLAVLSPYGQQRKRLANALQEDRSLLEVLKGFKAPSHNGQFCHTVDSFQGSEADVVLVSLVRNNHHSSVQQALGFLTDPRRMNVLLSRAKWQLILIFSRSFLSEVISVAEKSEDAYKVEFLSKMLDSLERGAHGNAVKIVPFDRLIGSKQ